jgi:5-methylcytosine-specific restriction endonuclease McrA
VICVICRKVYDGHGLTKACSEPCRKLRNQQMFNSEKRLLTDKIRRLKKAKEKAEYDRQYRVKNKEYYKAKSVEYYEEKKTYIKAVRKIQFETVRPKRREYERNHRKANKDKDAAKSSFRRARKSRATPKWLSDSQKKEMRDIFAKARKMGELDNCKYEVDHIVPLNSDIICGLHVPWNLQILKESENRKKSNKLIDIF